MLWQLKRQKMLEYKNVKLSSSSNWKNRNEQKQKKNLENKKRLNFWKKLLISKDSNCSN